MATTRFTAFVELRGMIASVDTKQEATRGVEAFVKDCLKKRYGGVYDVEVTACSANFPLFEAREMEQQRELELGDEEGVRDEEPYVPPQEERSGPTLPKKSS